MDLENISFRHLPSFSSIPIMVYKYIPRWAMLYYGSHGSVVLLVKDMQYIYDNPYLGQVQKEAAD